jgi:hypothetical protein
MTEKSCIGASSLSDNRPSFNASQQSTPRLTYL